MRYLIIAITFFLLVLDRLFQFIGLAGAVDDVGTWGKFMDSIGLVNFIAIISFLLAVYLFYLDYRERQQTNAKMRVMASYFPGRFRSFFRRVRFIDPHMAIGHIARHNDHSALTKGEMHIEHIRARVTSNAFRRMTITRCYARSKITGEVIEAELRSPMNKLPISPKRGRECDFYIRFPEELSIADFRQKWSEFSIIVEHSFGQTELTYEPFFVDWMLFDITTGLHWKSRPYLKDD